MGAPRRPTRRGWSLATNPRRALRTCLVRPRHSLSPPSAARTLRASGAEPDDSEECDGWEARFTPLCGAVTTPWTVRGLRDRSAWFCARSNRDSSTRTGLWVRAALLIRAGHAELHRTTGQDGESGTVNGCNEQVWCAASLHGALKMHRAPAEVVRCGPVPPRFAVEASP